MKQGIFLIISCLFVSISWAAGGSQPLKDAEVDLHDKASLQRGAKWYINYCAGCHSLKYARYKGMAADVGLIDAQGQVYTDAVQDNLIFTGAKIGNLIKNAIPTADARQWFGVEPPDLTLVARVRGYDWLYTYLTSFYRDNDKPWGTNNSLFPDVGMPNVLAGLQGEQMPVYRSELVPYDGGTKEIQVIDHLQLIEDGAMTQHQFDLMIRDIVNFLAYIAEPVKVKRQFLGIMVLLFLGVLTILSYLLKKAYWQDIPKNKPRD